MLCKDFPTAAMLSCPRQSTLIGIFKGNIYRIGMPRSMLNHHVEENRQISGARGFLRISYTIEVGGCRVTKPHVHSSGRPCKDRLVFIYLWMPKKCPNNASFRSDSGTNYCIPAVIPLLVFLPRGNRSKTYDGYSLGNARSNHDTVSCRSL